VSYAYFVHKYGAKNGKKEKDENMKMQNKGNKQEIALHLHMKQATGSTACCIRNLKIAPALEGFILIPVNRLISDILHRQPALLDAALEGFVSF
jgi:hypothetical protein